MFTWGADRVLDQTVGLLLFSHGIRIFSLIGVFSIYGPFIRAVFIFNVLDGLDCTVLGKLF